MPKEGSVAPKERVNITYKATIGDAQQEIELPLKMLVLGDFTGRKDDRVIEDRKPTNVDKDNFAEVLAEYKLATSLSVKDRLSNEEGEELAVSLKFDSLKDFTPDGIVQQVPELQKLLELRKALIALKGPLGNTPAFRKKIEGILSNAETRNALMGELGLDSSKD